MIVDIAVFDGLDELDVVGPYEVLQSAARLGADLDTRLVSPLGTHEVTGAFGLRIGVNGHPRENAEMILVPGGGWTSGAPVGVGAEIANKNWEQILLDARARGAVIIGICTGTMLLAHAGLLAGRAVSTHHRARADLEAFDVTVLADRVVDDGDLITSGGVTSGIDCALWIVERFYSRELADAVAERMEYERVAPQRAAH
jgi:transcriptional regulator GlxA family with amidase domain